MYNTRSFNFIVVIIFVFYRLPGSVTLTHLVCALNSVEGCERLLRDSPQKTIWEIKDHLGIKWLIDCGKYTHCIEIGHLFACPMN